MDPLHPHQKRRNCVSAGGFEPPTDSLRGNCSTIELVARLPALPFQDKPFLIC